MSRSSITRRRFNQWLAASLLLGGCGKQTSTGDSGGRPGSLKVAAIQMAPKLGDITANLEQAGKLIIEAQGKGAQWIILPEMFTSAVAFHNDMLRTISDYEGAPLKMLKSLARKGGTVIGGSYLARRSGQVFNTFVLVFPDGKVVQHDKDDPTYWENCYYRGGHDDGVMQTPIGPVGSALCWEFIRSRTAKRLLGKVNLVVGGSCWWTVPDEVDADNPRRKANLKMLKDAAPRMARMLGVPVVHGSHAGQFKAFFSPELPDVAYNSSYLGEAMIVDADGKVLVRRSKEEGAGVLTAEIQIPVKPKPVESIPSRFWTPKEMPGEWKASWKRWFDKGEDYYKLVTLPFLKTGKINEYTPKYMRD